MRTAVPVVGRRRVQARPDAELAIIEGSVHTGSPAMRTSVLSAVAKQHLGLPQS